MDLRERAARAPQHGDEWAPYQHAVIKGLKSAAGQPLNGKEAVLISFDAEKRRWNVSLEINGKEVNKSLKRENLHRINESYSKTLCRVCGKLATTKCGRCGLVFYCSGTCQSQDWKDHKTGCSRKPQSFARHVAGGRLTETRKIKEMKRAYKKDPRNPMYSMNLAACYIARRQPGDTKLALKFANKGLKLVRARGDDFDVSVVGRGEGINVDPSAASAGVLADAHCARGMELLEAANGERFDPALAEKSFRAALVCHGFAQGVDQYTQYDGSEWNVRAMLARTLKLRALGRGDASKLRQGAPAWGSSITVDGEKDMVHLARPENLALLRSSRVEACRAVEILTTPGSRPSGATGRNEAFALNILSETLTAFATVALDGVTHDDVLDCLRRGVAAWSSDRRGAARLKQMTDLTPQMRMKALMQGPIFSRLVKESSADEKDDEDDVR